MEGFSRTYFKSYHPVIVIFDLTIGSMANQIIMMHNPRLVVTHHTVLLLCGGARSDLFGEYVQRSSNDATESARVASNGTGLFRIAGGLTLMSVFST